MANGLGGMEHGRGGQLRAAVVTELRKNVHRVAEAQQHSRGRDASGSGKIGFEGR